MARARPRSVTFARGFTAAGGTCGLKASGAADLALIVSDRPCAAAAVFTRNKLPGAPLSVARRHLRRGGVRAIICNSGIANDATGQEGVRNAQQTTELVAGQLGCRRDQVLPASTGVIGPQLPMDRIARGVADVAKRLARGPGADADAARAIMTTDLVPKAASRTLRLGGRTIHLGGIAKGSGMICPNMATMLAFVTTDAAVTRPALTAALRAAVAVSFNRISVDQHTSPSDMVIVLANGAAGNRTLGTTGPAYKALAAALADVCTELAYRIVKDGEGATKVFRVRVTGARSGRDADRIGKAIVDSPLVKTAVHGGDPNWGRVVTAAGYSGAAIRPARMSLYIGPRRDVCVFRCGEPAPCTNAQQKRLQRLMGQKEVTFTLDVGLGSAEADWLGCDLSREYIRINAEYTT